MPLFEALGGVPKWSWLLPRWDDEGVRPSTTFRWIRSVAAVGIDDHADFNGPRHSDFFSPAPRGPEP